MGSWCKGKELGLSGSGRNERESTMQSGGARELPVSCWVEVATSGPGPAGEHSHLEDLTSWDCEQRRTMTSSWDALQKIFAC